MRTAGRGNEVELFFLLLEMLHVQDAVLHVVIVVHLARNTFTWEHY